MGDEFEFLGSVDTNIQRIVTAVAVPGNMRYSSRNVDLGWGSGWKFDSTTKFYICSNTDGSMTIRCSVKHFAVFQTYLGVDNRFQYFGGIYRKFFMLSLRVKIYIATIIANYAMDEGIGTTIVDNQGSLGNARLGADCLEWLNNVKS